MKIRVWVSTNKINSKCVREIEIDDDTIDSDIEQIAEDTKNEMTEWNWEKI